jgi:Asp-tRNA(Asn)/Glu-tRNA(Gln) amidotransferase A subunit family amidase
MITRLLQQNIKGTAGLPVGIQVIGLPFEEEKVLSLMQSIEAGFHFDKYRKITHLSPHTS